jgi:N-acetylglucosamine kinase-like BadF-type ATPase
LIPAVLAIDGGNSKTDVALIADDGTVLAALRGPGTSQEHLGLDGAMRATDPLISAVAELAGLPAGEGPVARHTSACLAGADLPSEEEALRAAVTARGWSRSSVVLNDTFAVLRAGVALGDGEIPWGIAVVCGAGINCTGVAPDGKVARFLAFGFMTGDWGAGEGLAQQVMYHASRHEDGRGSPTALTAGTAAYFGLASVADVAVAVHEGRIPLEELLGLTTVLFAAAEEGDPAAVSLVERQGEEICLMVSAAHRQLALRPADPVPVILGGGLLQARNPLLTDTITRRLTADMPGAELRIVDTPPIVGAALLGLDHLAAASDSGWRVAPAATAARLRKGFAAPPTRVHTPNDQVTNRNVTGWWWNG